MLDSQREVNTHRCFELEIVVGVDFVFGRVAQIKVDFLGDGQWLQFCRLEIVLMEFSTFGYFKSQYLLFDLSFLVAPYELFGRTEIRNCRISQSSDTTFMVRCRSDAVGRVWTSDKPPWKNVADINGYLFQTCPSRCPILC